MISSSSLRSPSSAIRTMRTTTMPPPPPSSSSSYEHHHGHHDVSSTSCTSTSMLLLEDIVNMNNIAAHEMLLADKKGNHRVKALKLLSDALKHSRYLLKSIQKTTKDYKAATTTAANAVAKEEEEGETALQEEQQPSMMPISGSTTTNQMISCSFLIPSNIEENEEDEDHHDGRCTLFKYPLQLDLSSTESDASSAVLASKSQRCCGQVVAATLPYVIIYNLALWHHMTSAVDLTAESNRLNHLKRAIALYGQAQRISIGGGCSRDNKMPSPLLHKIVICNNLGCAYQALDDIEMSKKCFRQLLIEARRTTTTTTTAADVVPSSSSILHQQGLSSKIINRFLWQAFHQLFGNSSAAAAA